MCSLSETASHWLPCSMKSFIIFVQIESKQIENGNVDLENKNIPGSDPPLFCIIFISSFLAGNEKKEERSSSKQDSKRNCCLGF